MRIQSEVIWRLGINAVRLVARSNVFFPGPRVFVNSIPNSGTHLARGLLRRMPWMMLSGIHVQKNWIARQTNQAWAGDAMYALTDFEPDPDAFRLVLRKANKGQIVTAHLPYRRELHEILGELDYRWIFLVRDPRDVLVSHMFYVCSNRRHHANRRFVEQGWSTKKRFLAILEGHEADAYGPGEDPLAAWYRQFLPWRDAPGGLAVAFEELVGPKGGGDAAKQLEMVQRLASHIGRPLTLARTQSLSRKVWSKRSVTFRRGQINAWSSEFDGELKEAFKRLCNGPLIQLGYEADSNW
jgi:hypothetical protein